MSAPYTLHRGDCLAVLRTMADASVDAIVTDPPYALPGGFMGKAWDNHDGREDAGFGYWLAGFTDGEGCFRVHRHERGTHTCAFQIKLRRDDKAVLERIRRFVGHGTVRDVEGEGNSNPQSVYVVQDKDGCDTLVGLFRRYHLTAKKANDFEVWAEAVWEWLERPRGNRWHGQADQSRAAMLKARLEDVRRYTDIPWSGHRFQDWCRCWALECMRVLKPGGHLLAFGAPRQYHRLAAGVEDAGFEVRDCVGWVFGSGYPKSHNLSGGWEGWGTALKPAWESIVVARKPLAKGFTVAANVLQHGTGALNIDGCRVATSENLNGGAYAEAKNKIGGIYGKLDYACGDYSQPSGRWPANLIHDGSDEVVAAFPDSNGSGPARTLKRGQRADDDGWRMADQAGELRDAGTGSAARFFYCAKASRADRNAGIPSSDTPTVATGATMREREDADWPARNGNFHPTVKPTDLMAYLVRLVTPPGGLVLDPFMGSGSTGKACMREGFRFVGIDLDDDGEGNPLGYVEIARARIEHELRRVEAARTPPPAPPQQDLFGDVAA